MNFSQQHISKEFRIVFRIPNEFTLFVVFQMTDLTSHCLHFGFIKILFPVDKDLQIPKSQLFKQSYLFQIGRFFPLFYIPAFVIMT